MLCTLDIIAFVSSVGRRSELIALFEIEHSYYCSLSALAKDVIMEPYLCSEAYAAAGYSHGRFVVQGSASIDPTKARANI